MANLKLRKIMNKSYHKVYTSIFTITVVGGGIIFQAMSYFNKFDAQKIK